MYKTMGNVSESCSIAGISRQIFYNWMDKDPEFAEAVEEVNEANVDFVESALLQKINDGDTTTIIFYLKTKGKSRGYVEKHRRLSAMRKRRSKSALPKPRKVLTPASQMRN